MKIYRTSGGTRIFNENNGNEAFVIQKVIKWINTSSHINETSEFQHLESYDLPPHLQDLMKQKDIKKTFFLSHSNDL